MPLFHEHIETVLIGKPSQVIEKYPQEENRKHLFTEYIPTLHYKIEPTPFSLAITSVILYEGIVLKTQTESRFMLASDNGFKIRENISDADVKNMFVSLLSIGEKKHNEILKNEIIRTHFNSVMLKENSREYLLKIFEEGISMWLN